MPVVPRAPQQRGITARGTGASWVMWGLCEGQGLTISSNDHPAPSPTPHTHRLPNCLRASPTSAPSTSGTAAGTVAGTAPGMEAIAPTIAVAVTTTTTTTMRRRPMKTRRTRMRMRTRMRTRMRRVTRNRECCRAPPPTHPAPYIYPPRNIESSLPVGCRLGL